ncbi:hypothetical protein C2857_003781 [Epichloe festucae Fl1]|uniref:Restriction of telomere capping protein 4 n=1 Tax=Epichloe festucae (strain Fl1) TaxID=877507 RepID=A0A7S9PVF3_EPIFF|nr:hypothetical protein C2857_003781 [Epichloe festucae Fl1]
MPLLNNRNSRTPHRRVGLSCQQRAPHLLSTFQHSPPVKPPIKKLKVPQAFDDPPVSTDEEDSQIRFQTPAAGAGTPQRKSRAINTPSETPLRKRSEVTGFSRLNIDDSSSGDELGARGDIKSTAFTSLTKAKGSEALQRNTRTKRKYSTAESATDVKPVEGKRQRKGEVTSAKRRKEAVTTSPASSGERLTNAPAFTQSKRIKRTYKKRENSSQELETKRDKDKSSLRNLEIPEDSILSPEKPKSKKLRLPPDAVPSSSPSKGPAKLKQVPDLEDSDDESSLKPSGSLASSQASSNNRRRRNHRNKPELERTPSPPRAVFKIPASPTRLESRTISRKEVDLSLSSDLSDADGSAGEDVHSRRKDVADAPKPAAVCPWCGEEVDANLLHEFSKGKRLNVRLQTKFCQKHKKKTAEEVWQQKDYPQVDWDGLDRRFALHSDLLLTIINGSPSYFRTIHEKNIESGKARSMKKEGNMNPGYYGPRGFNIMCDYLVEEFGDLLKKKAVDDKVIAGRGSAAFIQNVLVAELAVQMIMEDMRVSEDEARIILEDSKALGELVHEDV